MNDTLFKDKAVLVFVIKNNAILLIQKLRGLGKGKINGPGGKLEVGESYFKAAIRETEEETGIRIISPVLKAELGFYFSDGYSLYGQVFVSTEYDGVLTDTDEALPFWCPLSEIPYDKMWTDDILWLPQVLLGERVSACFEFDGDTLLSAQVSSWPESRAYFLASTKR